MSSEGHGKDFEYCHQRCVQMVGPGVAGILLNASQKKLRSSFFAENISRPRKDTPCTSDYHFVSTLGQYASRHGST